MAAYWIAHVNIHDPEQYQHYMDLAPAAFNATTRALSLAAAGRKRWRDNPSPSTYLLSLTIWKARWPATTQRNINRRAPHARTLPTP